jgi:hypothetical protein
VASDEEKYPNRPDHPDFWLLANSTSGMDELIETHQGDFDFEALVEAYVDPKSLAYIALQRSMRAFGVETVSELQEMKDYVQRGAALYHEAFLLGAGYQEDKDAKADD